MGALSKSNPQLFQPQRDLHPAHAVPARFSELMVPLEQLLITGSDARLALDPATHLNVYGCAPSPRPAVISFASTTASSISPRAYAAVQSAREQFAQASLDGARPQLFDEVLDALRTDLKKAFLIDDPGVEVVLAPSGTDSQLCALFMARACLGTPITSIIVAAEETGSGTAFTALGQHFNSQTAHGSSVVKGAAIDGLAGNLSRIDIFARDHDGIARNAKDVDDDVIASIARARAEGRNVLLLAMDQSKSGLGGPSEECLRLIEEKFGTSVIIVIDACQGRLSRQALNRHLGRGHIVLMTGSKFFTGPPFSGATFVPPAIAERMTCSFDVPAGLGDYSGQSEWPRHWIHIRRQLPEQLNFGMWLRWEAALAEIKAYHNVPEAFRETALERFAESVPQLLEEFEFCRLVDPGQGTSGETPHGTVRTIYPFLVVKDGVPLSFDSAREIYAALNRDLSTELRNAGIRAPRPDASTLCHIGQPLLMREHRGREIGALRLSVDARLISDAWQPDDERGSIDRIERKIQQIRAVLKKIEILLELRSEREVFA